MVAEILGGKALAASLRTKLRARVDKLIAADFPPSLLSLQVGESQPSRAYIQSQRRACAEHDILYTHLQLDGNVSERQFLAHVRSACENPEVTGVIIQLPVPVRLDVRRAYHVMDPAKDVEGMHPFNLGSVFLGEGGLQPCTACAVLALVRSTKAELRGADVCVIGHSDLVGKPMSVMFLHENATVTTCHVHTRDLAEKTRAADVLVVAAGQPALIGAEHIREGACVIDVGINYLEGRTRPIGDVRFEEARAVAGAITPVPGGVGPITVSMLLLNTVRAAEEQLERRQRVLEAAEAAP